MRHKRVIEAETTPDGYVRLPLFGHCGYGTIETRDEEERHIRYPLLYPSMAEEMRINVEYP